MSYININGKVSSVPGSGIRVDSRAFRYGYGLFETMLVRDGRIPLGDLHWERLMSGMAALGIDTPGHFLQEVKEGVAALVRKNGHDDLGRVRLQVWPSSGGLYDESSFSAEYCIESFSLNGDVLALNGNGLVVGIAVGMTKAVDAYSHIKTCSALTYALAAKQAKGKKWNDALLLNDQGRVADSTIANVFWVVSEKLFTPPLSEGGVAGVMRQHLLNSLAGWGYEIEEQSMHPQAIASADTVFLTNAIRGINWVSECAGQRLERGISIILAEKLLRSIEI